MVKNTIWPQKINSNSRTEDTKIRGTVESWTALRLMKKKSAAWDLLPVKKFSLNYSINLYGLTS